MVDYNLLISSAVGSFLNSIYGGWLLLATALIVLSTSIVALIYMIGVFLANEKIKAWAKMEFVELFYSVVLIALTLSFLGSADYLLYGITTDVISSDVICGPEFGTSAYYQGIPCHIRLAMYFMNSLFNEGKDIAFGIYWKYAITSAIAETTINLEVITEQAGVFAYNPIKGLFAVSNAVEATMFDYIVKIMTITKFQEVLLRLIALALFPVMFTLGIILRSFFFTRKLGGLLMAIALSLYFILPMFYVVGGAFFTEFKLKAMAAATAAGEDPADALALHALYINMDGFPSLDSTTGFTTDFSAIMKKDKAYFEGGDEYKKNDPYGPGPKTAIEKIESMAVPDLCKKINYADSDAEDKSVSEAVSNTGSWLDKLGEKSYYNPTTGIPMLMDIGGYIDSTSRLTFFSLFFSFLGVMASIAAIKSLSAIFGGDLEIAGLTHLI